MKRRKRDPQAEALREKIAELEADNERLREILDAVWNAVAAHKIDPSASEGKET